MRSHYGPTLSWDGELEVIDCEPCGYAHLHPLPNPREVESLYEDDQFYAAGGKLWFEKERHEHEKGYWDAEYKLRRKLLGKRHLWDVGCGTGEFVGWWYENYFPLTAIGYEPSKMARNMSPFKKWVLGDISQVEFNVSIQKGYSLIRPALCFSLVFEHVYDPVEELKKWVRLVGPDVRVLIKVPNEFNPLQAKLERKHGDWFVTKEHLNYFTPAGLRNAIKKAGLMVTWEGATFPMEFFALAGFDYIGNDELGKACHLARLRFEKALGIQAFHLYRVLYKLFGWGRELIFLAEE